MIGPQKLLHGRLLRVECLYYVKWCSFYHQDAKTLRIAKFLACGRASKIVLLSWMPKTLCQLTENAAPFFVSSWWIGRCRLGKIRVRSQATDLCEGVKNHTRLGRSSRFSLQPAG